MGEFPYFINPYSSFKETSKALFIVYDDNNGLYFRTRDKVVMLFLLYGGDHDAFTNRSFTIPSIL